MFPSIDHSLISPSGKMSKRARNAAIRREAANLFPAEYLATFEKTPEAIKEEKILSLRLAAEKMRQLASRGMQPRRLSKEAARLEKLADSIEV